HALWLHPIIVGPLDGIPTVEVAADGTVSATEGDMPTDPPGSPIARLATLSARDLVDVLALVAEVAPRQEEGTDGDEPAPAADPATASSIGTASIDAADAVDIAARSGDTAALAHLPVPGPTPV